MKQMLYNLIWQKVMIYIGSYCYIWIIASTGITNLFTLTHLFPVRHFIIKIKLQQYRIAFARNDVERVIWNLFLSKNAHKKTRSNCDPH